MDLAKCSLWKARYNYQTKLNSTLEPQVHVGETLLHRAIRLGNKKIIKTILHKEKGNIELKNRDG